MAKSKKIVKKKNTDKESKDVVMTVSSRIAIANVNFQDLCLMYTIIDADMNMAAGGRNKDAKDVIRSRHAEVKAELYFRLYGLNPFNAVREVIVDNLVGADPEEVLKNLSVEKG